MSKPEVVWDTSSELIIQRHMGGIKLINRDKIFNKNNLFIKSTSYYTVKNLLELPMNIYFMDTESSIKNGNDYIQMCGFNSLKDAIGKNLRVVAKRETASICINHDLEVMKTKKMKRALAKLGLISNMLPPVMY